MQLKIEREREREGGKEGSGEWGLSWLAYLDVKCILISIMFLITFCDKVNPLTLSLTHPFSLSLTLFLVNALSLYLFLSHRLSGCVKYENVVVPVEFLINFKFTVTYSQSKLNFAEAIKTKSFIIFQLGKD